MEKPIIKGKIDVKYNKPNFIKKQNQVVQPKQSKIKYFEQYKQELVFQLKSGTIIEGVVEKEDMGFITIKNATVIGKEYIGNSDWICIERTQISHFHPKLVNIIKKESTNGK